MDSFPCWALCKIFRNPHYQPSLSYSPLGIVVVQSVSHVRLFATPWTAARLASLSLTISPNLLKFMSVESVMPPNHLILCCLLLLLPSVFPSIRVFLNESTLHIRWAKYWNFSFSVSPSNEYAELSSLRIDWLDLLAVQGTVKSLLQHHSIDVHYFLEGLREVSYLLCTWEKFCFLKRTHSL